MLKKLISLLLIACSSSAGVVAQESQTAPSATHEVAEVSAAGQPALTIYNQNFAVVRDRLALALSPGVNALRFAAITAHVEPDSVMLRDPLATHVLQVLEQNYRADPVTQELLLSLYEGKTIEFLTPNQSIIKGKVVRAGYVPRYGGRYNDPYNTAGSQPIIEVDGTLRFSLPGQPLFPALTGDTVLKPSLNWLMQTDKPGQFEAELSYVTSGLSWEADYNLVAPEKGDVLDMVGWVTITNNSGTVFNNANIKLLAGDVDEDTTGRSDGLWRHEDGDERGTRRCHASGGDRTQLRRVPHLHHGTREHVARSGDEADRVRAWYGREVETALRLRRCEPCAIRLLLARAGAHGSGLWNAAGEQESLGHAGVHELAGERAAGSRYRVAAFVSIAAIQTDILSSRVKT